MTAPAPVIETPISAPTRRSGSGSRPPRTLWSLALLILIPVVLPMGYLVVRAAGAGGEAWEILTSGRTLRLLVNTLGLAASVTISSIAVGVATAWLTVRTDIPGRRIWSLLAAVPLVIPSYVVALALVAASGPGGLLSDWLGVTLPGARTPWGTWLALTIATFPYVHLVAAASLRRTDPATEDAARSLGASPARVFRTIVLPQLRPAVAAGGLLVALYTLSDFGVVSILRYDAFTRVIYAQYQGRLDRTPAAVLAVVLIVIALVVIIAEGRSRSRGVHYANRPSRDVRPTALRPRTKGIALGFLTVVATVSVVLPITVLTAWVIRGTRTGSTPSFAIEAAVNSLGVSGLAALVAMAAAIPISMLVVRHRSRASVALDRTVYGLFALPHITIGLAMVFFVINFVPALYQGLAILVVTYAAIFLPQATGPARAALSQISPSLDEASRSLGRGPLRTMFSITVPLMWRGLLAGGVLVFLTTMKELPATLLLRPTGFDTLAVKVWSAASEGFFARAAAPALVLLVVSAVPMWFLVARDDLA